MTKDNETETALVKSDEAPPVKVKELAFTAKLAIPEQDAEFLLAQLSEFGTVQVHEEPVPGVVAKGPSRDAYGNRYDGLKDGPETGRPTHDAYGNPFAPVARVAPDPDTLDSYGNPLTPPVTPNHNHSVSAPPREDGRPLRDNYGNEYKGRY